MKNGGTSPAGGLSQEQRELLALLLAEEGIEPEDDRIEPRSGNEEEIPLSFAQERMWILQQLDPHGAAYNIPSTLRMQGPLDNEALRRALSEIVRRHESLRTTIHFEAGRLSQRISPSAELMLPVIDLRGLAADLRLREAGLLAAREGHRSFDLERDLLLRCCLVRLADRDHVLIATMHHIASDLWSRGVLTR